MSGLFINKVRFNQKNDNNMAVITVHTPLPPTTKIAHAVTSVIKDNNGLMPNTILSHAYTGSEPYAAARLI